MDRILDVAALQEHIANEQLDAVRLELQTLSTQAQEGSQIDGSILSDGLFQLNGIGESNNSDSSFFSLLPPSPVMQ
jgi:hypothetical protein